MRLLAAIVAVAFVAGCSPEAGKSDTRDTPVTTSTSAAPQAEGWEVSDERVWTRDDLAFWIVSYDARWLESGPPQPQKCVFKVKNQEGTVVRQTGETLEEGDDVEAETIYPDEVPGQPTTVSVDCEV